MRVVSGSRTRQWFISLCLFLLPGFVLGCAASTVEPSPSPITAHSLDFDPAVTKLLEIKAEVKAPAEFVNHLETLAKVRGWWQQYTECKKHAFFDWDEARAVSIQSGQDQCVVVLLKSGTHSIPGSEVQTAILLDNWGRYLDHLRCEISSRLTLMAPGQFHTVTPGEPEADGAQLIIRLDGVSARGNFAHRVYHGGEGAEFTWGHDNLPPGGPTEWDTKGLCRIAIKDGRFKILLPDVRNQGQRREP